MSDYKRISTQVKRDSPHAVWLACAFLHSGVLIIAALFSCGIIPCLGLLPVTESEAPVDQDESSEEAASSARVRTHFSRTPSSLPLVVSLSGGINFATTRIFRVPDRGHRLHNNLLAPLRC